MEQLDMIKVFAKLEGVDLIPMYDTEGVYICEIGDGFRYDPITDLALNCAARDKYEVEIDYSTLTVTDFCNDNLDITYVECQSKLEINEAVIECILKSKGLWV